MKLETKRKIRRWVCRRLRLPEMEPVPYPVNVYQGNAEILCCKISYRVTEAPYHLEYMKRMLREKLAEALMENDRCKIVEEDSPTDLFSKVVTVKVRVVPWKE